MLVAISDNRAATFWSSANYWMCPRQIERELTFFVQKLRLDMEERRIRTELLSKTEAFSPSRSSLSSSNKTDLSTAGNFCRSSSMTQFSSEMTFQPRNATLVR